MTSSASVELRFDAGERAPGMVRHGLHEFLGRYGDRVAHDAQLVISELVTNVVRHAGRGGTVKVFQHGECLRVEVTDCASRIPTVAPPSPRRPRGFGMWVIDAICDAWGVELHRDDGKTVWADIPLH